MTQRLPEYLHVLLNPLPVYGLAVGLLALIGAFIARSRAARITSLAIVFAAALSAWPVHQYGEAAYDRVLAMTDNDGGKWLEEHQRRSEQLISIFYLTAFLAAGALASERLAPRAALPLAIATAVIATAALVAGGYIAQAGGRVRHREFRYEPPPENAKQHED